MTAHNSDVEGREKGATPRRVSERASELITSRLFVADRLAVAASDASLFKQHRQTFELLFYQQWQQQPQQQEFVETSVAKTAIAGNEYAQRAIVDAVGQGAVQPITERETGQGYA